jgi:hypothetical protein
MRSMDECDAPRTRLEEFGNDRLVDQQCRRTLMRQDTTQAEILRALRCVQDIRATYHK